jgi:nitroreductase
MRRPTAGRGTPRTAPDAIARALEEAVDRGRLAPSVHNTQPWTFVLFPDRVELRADRTRQLPVLDPHGRELVLSIGAALLNVRAALAARRFAADVARLPSPDDPDLLAVVRPIEGPPEAGLAALDRVAHLRHTNRRPFEPATVPDEVIDVLVEVAAAEHALLVPIRDPAQSSLVAELTQEADRLQEADPAYRAELEHWISRPPAQGDGVPASSVPRTPRTRRDAVPLRDFDVRGTGGLPSHTGSGTEQTMVLVATPHDEPLDWLRSGEALERLLLELTRRDWVAGPLTQALEVPTTRERLRRLTAPAHPQMLMRIGRAARADSTGRRPRRTVVVNSTRPTPPTFGTPPPEPAAPPPPQPRHRPVSDGRGGTTWV